MSYRDSVTRSTAAVAPRRVSVKLPSSYTVSVRTPLTSVEEVSRLKAS